VIAARRLQRHFAEGFIAEAVADLWEPWMRHADTALEDDARLLIIQQELAKRCKKSKTRGRNGARAVKAASVFSNAGMGCGDRSIESRRASGAGSDSGSSPTT
jgi:hypothetical protein